MFPMLNDVPRPALALGIAGLIPFVACTAGLWLADPVWQAEASRMLLGYAAVILTFLGGVHWGKALADEPAIAATFGSDLNWVRLGWSVTPSLVAWGAMLLSPVAAIFCFVPAFALAFLIDRQAVRTGFFPEWYLPLRKLLTLGVLTCLIIASGRIFSGI